MPKAELVIKNGFVEYLVDGVSFAEYPFDWFQNIIRQVDLFDVDILGIYKEKDLLGINGTRTPTRKTQPKEDADVSLTKYPFTVKREQVGSHVFWTATSAVLHGCVGQGDTAEKAIQELATNENEWIDTAKKHGIPIPEKKLDAAEDHSPQTQEAHNEQIRSALSQGGT